MSCGTILYQEVLLGAIWMEQSLHLKSCTWFTHNAEKRGVLGEAEPPRYKKITVELSNIHFVHIMYTIYMVAIQSLVSEAAGTFGFTACATVDFGQESGEHVTVCMFLPRHECG